MQPHSRSSTTVVFVFAAVVAVIVVIISLKFILTYQLPGGGLLVSPDLKNISKRFTPALYECWCSAHNVRHRHHRRRRRHHNNNNNNNNNNKYSYFYCHQDRLPILKLLIW